MIARRAIDLGVVDAERRQLRSEHLPVGGMAGKLNPQGIEPSIRIERLCVHNLDLAQRAVRYCNVGEVGYSPGT